MNEQILNEFRGRQVILFLIDNDTDERIWDRGMYDDLVAAWKLHPETVLPHKVGERRIGFLDETVKPLWLGGKQVLKAGPYEGQEYYGRISWDGEEQIPPIPYQVTIYPTEILEHQKPIREEFQKTFPFRTRAPEFEEEELGRASGAEGAWVIKEKADKPLGYPPNPIIRKALESLYTSIVGALHLGDFETFLKESADLTYDEAKDKMVREYGTPKELSEAKLKAKTAEAEAKLEQAERETLEEQKTIVQEFAELEETARKRLAENFEMMRRNEELEREVKRLREELAKAKVAPLGVPVPVPAAPPVPAHGSMYQEYRRRVSDAVTMADVTDIANELYDILEKEEFDKLTKGDISELLEELRKTGERRAMKLAEMRIPEIKPKIRKAPPVERVEAPPAFVGVLPTQVMHRYTRPDTKIFVSMGEEFIRDFELERTLQENRILLFPKQWYELSSWGKRERYGWDIASAMREVVDHLHKFSWDGLEKDYGIPSEYIKAWKSI